MSSQYKKGYADKLMNTLLTFDVVDLDGNPSRSILDTINKEGRVLYEAI